VASTVGSTPKELAYSFVYDEITGLIKYGVDVHVVRFKFGKPNCFSGICFHDIEKCELLSAWRTIKSLYKMFSSITAPRSTFVELLYSHAISKAIRLINPHIVHAHFAYPEGWCTLLAKSVTVKNIPLVVTVHGYDINVLPEYGYGVRLLRKYDAKVKVVLKRANCIIAVSRDLALKVKELGAENVVYIPNGVDTSTFNPIITPSEREKIDLLKRKWGVEDADVVIGFFRHLKPWYGVHYIPLIAKLVLRNVGIKVKFVLAGDGGAKYIKMLHKISSKFNLENNIIYVGKLPRTIMPLAYKAVDIAINTSLTDGMPPSTLEAMASGKPVVSFASGGNKDLILNWFNGFLIPLGDYRTFAEKLLYLIENPSEIRRMGINSRRLAEERFNINKKLTM